MTSAERRLAEAWYQALREWKTRRLTDEIPRGPRRTPGAPPARVVWGCPVCRALDVAEIDTALLDARAAGEDPSPLIREIARRLRVREAVVWAHYRDHLDPDPPRPLIGEWARHRRVSLGEHLLTPAGWIPVERVLAAIREAPEEVRVRLDQVRFGKGPRRLVTPNGWWVNGRAKRFAEAVLWLASAVSRQNRV